MPKTISTIFIIVGGVMLIGYLLAYHYQTLGKILARMVGGVCSIIIINYILSVIGIHSGVGVNLYSILATGLFGVQGVFFLYVTAGFLAIFY